MQLKKVISFLLFSFLLNAATAQTDSVAVQKPTAKPKVATDSNIKKIDTVETIVAIDSFHLKDSLAKLRADSLQKDSLQKAAVAQQKKESDTATYASILNHPFLPFNKPPVYEITQVKPAEQKDELFYLLVATIFFIALIKVLSPKYFTNIFGLFFQTSFRQKHTRDQLLQYKIASLCMNVLFFITGGLYIALAANQLQMVQLNFWWLLLYCFIILAAVYIVKYLFLIFSGWVFNVKEAAGTYIFVVFLVNKIAGIVLLPIVLLLAFSNGIFSQTVITVSLIIVALLLVYRYIVSVGTVRKDLKVNAIHFFLYLCTVEIMPLLLIYKLLFNYIGVH